MGFTTISKLKESQHVLVTGGAGYIGSLVCRDLLKLGHKVIAFDKLLFGTSSLSTLGDSYPNQFKFIQGDISDRKTVSNCLQHSDVVIHLAAIVGDLACSTDADQTIKTNVDATKELARQADEAGLERLLFSSSCSVYGINKEWSDESSPAHSISLYSQTKLDAEDFLLTSEFNSLDVSILRCGTTFGLSPRMRFDLVVNYLAKQALKERSIKIFGGEQWRPFVHVHDVATVFSSIALAESWDNIRGQIINVGSNANNYQLKEIAKLLEEIFPELEIDYLQSKEDQRSYRVRFDKLSEIIGTQPTTDLRVGINEIADAIQSGRFADIDEPKYYNNLMTY